MMFGRLFGKSNDASDAPVCDQCGRTLLAGEWTQTIEGPDGEERLLCSLCGQVSPPSGGARLKGDNGVSKATRTVADEPAAVAEQPTRRGENDALWKAIKDRDAQIEALTERLAQSEAERQELIGRLARLQAETARSEAPAEDVPVEAGGAGTTAPAHEADVGQPPLEDTAAIPAAEVERAADERTEDERARVERAEDEGVKGESAEVVAAWAASEEAREEEATSVPDGSSGEAETTLETRAAAAAAARDEAAAAAADVPLDTSAAEAQAASMTLLQRGVDLLNVSPVPRKIAETNADLGIPSVHVGFDGATATVTFMWSMGWYRFAVDIETGGVRLGDRGYDDRQDLQPNASVRADGTGHLASARISHAAAQRQQEQGETASEADTAAEIQPAAQPTAEPAPAGGGPEILSKSLLGQRTDDERPSWEQTQAREFDWER